MTATLFWRRLFDQEAYSEPGETGSVERCMKHQLGVGGWVSPGRPERNAGPELQLTIETRQRAAQHVSTSLTRRMTATSKNTTPRVYAKYWVRMWADAVNALRSMR